MDTEYEVSCSVGLTTASNIKEAITQFQLQVEAGNLFFRVKDIATGKVYEVDGDTNEVEEIQ